MILAGMVLVSSEVIAAPQKSEQATDSIQSDNLGLFADWWPVPVAILALIIFFKLPDLGLRQAPLRNWSFSPFVGLFFFFVTVLGGALAAEILVALVGRPVPPDELVDDSEPRAHVSPLLLKVQHAAEHPLVVEKNFNAFAAQPSGLVDVCLFGTLFARYVPLLRQPDFAALFLFLG